MGQILKSNEKGQITYNPDKEMYYLEIGNVLVTLDDLQYKELKKVVRHLSTDPRVYGEHGRIKVPFESDNIALVFNLDEIIALKDLFGFRPDKSKMKLKINFSVN